MHDFDCLMDDFSDFNFNTSTPPIVPSNGFYFQTVEEMRDAMAREREVPFYTRGTNPTVKVLEKKMASLEKAESALIFASGSAAIASAVMANVGKGDHIVSVQKPYSWTGKLFSQLLPRFGVDTTFVDGTAVENYAQAIQPNTKLLYLESPNSWTFELQDIKAVADLAKSRGLLSFMDNSYATPINTKPITMGVDVVMHSATKYLGGHGDALGGVVASSKSMIDKLFKSEYMTLGGVISPFNAWLLTRGLRTLPLRMEKVSTSTPMIVKFLEQHPKVDTVNYPYSESHPQFDLAKTQMKKPAGQFSVVLKTKDSARIEAFCNALTTFKLAASWGGYESLAFPAITFSTSLNYQTNEIPMNMIRFYVGLEDVNTLIKDLDRALSYA